MIHFSRLATCQRSRPPTEMESTRLWCCQHNERLCVEAVHTCRGRSGATVASPQPPISKAIEELQARWRVATDYRIMPVPSTKEYARRLACDYRAFNLANCAIKRRLLRQIGALHDDWAPRNNLRFRHDVLANFGHSRSSTQAFTASSKRPCRARKPTPAANRALTSSLLRSLCGAITNLTALMMQ
jgi:hypothetical protein